MATVAIREICIRVLFTLIGIKKTDSNFCNTFNEGLTRTQELDFIGRLSQLTIYQKLVYYQNVNNVKITFFGKINHFCRVKCKNCSVFNKLIERKNILLVSFTRNTKSNIFKILFP